MRLCCLQPCHCYLRYIVLYPSTIAKLLYRIVAWHSAVELFSVNATKSHLWCVNIGLGNGLVPSGSKLLPKPVLTKFLSPHGHTRPKRNWCCTARLLLKKVSDVWVAKIYPGHFISGCQAYVIGISWQLCVKREVFHSNIWFACRFKLEFKFTRGLLIRGFFWGKIAYPIFVYKPDSDNVGKWVIPSSWKWRHVRTWCLKSPAIRQFVQ